LREAQASRVGQLRVFAGAVAIITGGASGIGNALGEALAERGCEVVLADFDGELAENAAAAICLRGLKATAASVDVTDFAAIRKTIDETMRRSGRLDYMFNNAGISISGEVMAHRMEDWDRIVDVNLRGVINGIQAALPLFVSQGFGHIVNTASMRGLVPVPLSVSYGATKAAVISISKSLRAEAASAGVRVSVLCPGVIKTPLVLGGRYHRILQPELGRIQRENWQRFLPMDPHIFARKALRQIARNKPIIVIPSWWRMLWWLDRISPTVSILLAQKLFEKLKRAAVARKE
jgi:NAD(P)-dependent dehydrogenase (short-subunit alcohol dehydrogenase family)